MRLGADFLFVGEVCCAEVGCALLLAAEIRHGAAVDCLKVRLFVFRRDISADVENRKCTNDLTDC